jgi:hypothetical protein
MLSEKYTKRRFNQRQATLYQSSNRKGWLYMTIYWIMGWLVGVRSGDLGKLYFGSSPLPTLRTIASLLVTLVLQMHLNVRYTPMNRNANLGSSVLFGLANGTSETMLFFGSYIFGKSFLFSMWCPTSNLYSTTICTQKTADIFGFFTFVVYAGLIHVLFWLPLAFPLHIQTDAKPFLIHGLPALIAMSVMWLYLYEMYDDILLVCVLHATIDTWTVVKIALPPPWAK